MLTFLLGPILAFLPKAWREALAAKLPIEWHIATMLSGFLECMLALVAMIYWYSYSMTTWVSHGLDSALSGKMPQGTNDQEVGFVAILIFALHPLTWCIGLFAIEGAVRLLGAFISGNVLGSLPLYLIDRVIARATKRDPNAEKISSIVKSNVAVTTQAIREKVLMARLPEVPDEVCMTRNETEEFLEIRASRIKRDWEPPRIVRYLDSYYRLEGSTQGTSERPFAYLLRRLPAGVPGRSVILYKPEMEPIEVKA